MQKLMKPGYLITILFLISACSSEEVSLSTPAATMVHDVGGATMGTRWSVKWVTDAQLPPVSGEVLKASLVEELDRINGLMSTWDPDSQLSVFNRTQSVDPMVLDDDTLAVIDTALSISRLTAGQYDITLQPVIDLWGFGGNDTPVTPDQADIDRALQSSGFSHIVRINNTVRKRVPGLSIDVSSLAKGFAVDQLGKVVESLGISHYLVDIGGELRARGQRGDGKAWRVGIESPDGDVPQILELIDTQIATSGSYRNYRVENGQRLSHIIDGETGRPVTHDVVSVSVIHKSAMLADAWATALMIVGKQKALSLIEQQGLTAQLTVVLGEQFERIALRGFSELLVSE